MSGLVVRLRVLVADEIRVDEAAIEQHRQVGNREHTGEPWHDVADPEPGAAERCDEGACAERNPERAQRQGACAAAQGQRETGPGVACEG